MGSKPKNRVGGLAREKWESSGLGDDHAKKLKLRPLTPEQTTELGPTFVHTESMLIPYFDLKGKPTKFYRVRYLGVLPGFGSALEKPQRYAQAPGTLNEVYLPPLLPKGTWEDLAEDANQPILITEGELKAAAGCINGFPTIGLGGVDVWRSKKRGITFLPALEAIIWDKRKVAIVFDSDAATNVNVVRAQRQLAQALLARGAEPVVVSLPATKDGKKQGLDDFLLAESAAAMMQLINDAPFFPEANALWGMNEEVVYVRNPGLVIERESGQRIAPPSFVAHLYANRHYIETTTNASGAIVTKKKPLAERWIKWEHRFEVSKISYAPGKPKLYDGTWNGWPGWGVEPKKGDVSLWKRLMARIFRGDKEAIDWFEKWCAYPIQNPGVKMYSAVLFWGVKHGTGKTLVAYLLKAIYGKNGIEIDSEKLQNSFNGWSENKQFVVGDEITASDSRMDKDKLKYLITRKEINVNQKYVPEYVIDDCINYFFTSQQPDALFVEDNDRRYFVWEVNSDPIPEELAREYDAWLKGEGPAYLMRYFLDLDTTGFNPRGHAMSTSSKKAMIMHGKSDLSLWCHQLKENPEMMLSVLGSRPAKDCDLFTSSQLLRAYDPEGVRRVTAGGMGRELIRSGFVPAYNGDPVRIENQILRLMVVRGDAEFWSKKASPKVIGDHYKQFFGMDTSKVGG